MSVAKCLTAFGCEVCNMGKLPGCKCQMLDHTPAGRIKKFLHKVRN